MKLFTAALLLLLWQGDPLPSPQPADFRYHRQLTANTKDSSEQACVVLDANVYAHAAPALRDLRLFDNGKEVPYATTVSEPATPDDEPAKILNLGMRGKKIGFDLVMPSHSYTDVLLDIDAKDFVATAHVKAGSADLGSFTLFDLTSQHLGRSNTLHLQESNSNLLSVEIDATPAPGAPTPSAFTAKSIRGVTVPPSREAQTLYTVVASTAEIQQKGQRSVAIIALPMQVPVERVTLRLKPNYATNFARTVTVTARADERGSRSESVSGDILRIHTNRNGRELKEENLSVPFTMGANLQGAAQVEVAIDNGNDQPLAMEAVQLEMRQRKLCWQAAAAAAPQLYYGNRDVSAAIYDYARLFTIGGRQQAAVLGSEEANSAFHETLERRPLTERYPQLLWLALIAVVGTLGIVALSSAKRLPK